MHCLACDCLLSDWENRRKHSVTGEYIQLCTDCLRDVLSISKLPIDGEQVDNAIYNPVREDEEES